jgi:hypothetical protein
MGTNIDYFQQMTGAYFDQMLNHHADDDYLNVLLNLAGLSEQLGSPLTVKARPIWQ